MGKERVALSELTRRNLHFNRAACMHARMHVNRTYEACTHASDVLLASIYTNFICIISTYIYSLVHVDDHRRTYFIARSVCALILCGH